MSYQCQIRRVFVKSKEPTQHHGIRRRLTIGILQRACPSVCILFCIGGLIPADSTATVYHDTNVASVGRRGESCLVWNKAVPHLRLNTEDRCVEGSRILYGHHLAKPLIGRYMIDGWHNMAARARKLLGLHSLSIQRRRRLLRLSAQHSVSAASPGT